MTQIDALAVRLGLDPAALAPVTACHEDELGRLVATVDRALLAADKEVEQGLERTLAAIPRPLRSRARGLLFPKDQA